MQREESQKGTLLWLDCICFSIADSSQRPFSNRGLQGDRNSSFLVSFLSTCMSHSAAYSAKSEEDIAASTYGPLCEETGLFGEKLRHGCLGEAETVSKVQSDLLAQPSGTFLIPIGHDFAMDA